MAQNAIQQVFDAKTQKTLLRIGLILLVLVILGISTAFVIRLFKKNDKPKGGNGNTSPINPDGTPNPLMVSQELKNIARDLFEASGWIALCSSLRCKTLLAMSALENAQLITLGKYYKDTHGKTLHETLDSFYLSGCCLEDAPDVVDTKLEQLQNKVKTLNI